MSSPVFINLEFTPNPNTLKYTFNTLILEKGAANFNSPQEAKGVSPLAEKLFEVPGVAAIMFGKSFATITKTEEGDWDTVHQHCKEILQQHLDAGLPILSKSQENTHKGGSSEIEQKIRHFLDEEVRPSVAMDGGDITFEKFENGIVYLYLQGACSGCPSSTMTLKMGIENRIKEIIPEVLEVVAI